MKPKKSSADASLYFHEDATADIARMDTSAVYGNMADAMKNAIVQTRDITIIQTIVVDQTLKKNGIQG